VGKSEDATLYEKDFNLWVDLQVEVLRNQKFEEADIERLCQELEAMGRRERREARAYLRTIVAYLLRLGYHPSVVERQEKRHRWQVAAGNARDLLEEMLAESPSLKLSLSNSLEDVYRRAVKQVARDAQVSPSVFPPSCPFSFEQVLDENFWPEAPASLNLPPEMDEKV